MNSRSYNNGKYVEIFYMVTPTKGESVTHSVIIDASTGQVSDVNRNTLVPDIHSDNKFGGVCCTKPDTCEGWITDKESCWITEEGFSWGL